MTEQEYWSALEYSLSRALQGMPKKHRGALWCDGICPEVYLLDDAPPRILGHAFIGSMSHPSTMDEWRFTFFLPAQPKSREEIDWESLMPAEDETGWVAVDEERQRIQLKPAVAD